jgi:hypothetical protein
MVGTMSDAAPTGPTFEQFLTGTPLLMSQHVQVELSRESTNHIRVALALPVVMLHCPKGTCSGMRFFDPISETIYCGLPDSVSAYFGNHFITYQCRNCQKTHKTYALRIRFTRIGTSGKTAEIMKIGEAPAFGEPRPNAVRDVLDDEIEFFERGYRAETAGLGIGAFAYYRRFVESHKDKIIAEIRKVAVAQGAKQDVLDTLDKAAKMISFENAVRTVKDAIPDSLRHSGGHSPLTLLHDALSAGLHNEDDEQCLELAKDIRLLLTDLAERTTQALKNNSELSQAVNRLLRKATARAT